MQMNEKKTDKKLLPGDSGLIFSLAVVALVAASLVFSAVLGALAAGSGMSYAEYIESVKNSYLYYLFNYLTTSVALLAAILVFSAVKKIKPFSQISRYFLKKVPRGTSFDTLGQDVPRGTNFIQPWENELCTHSNRPPRPTTLRMEYPRPSSGG